MFKHLFCFTFTCRSHMHHLLYNAQLLQNSCLGSQISLQYFYLMIPIYIVLKSSWEKKQFSQNYCTSFCKILQHNAFSLTNSWNILPDMFECFQILQKTHYSSYVRVVFTLEESCWQCFCYRTKRIIHFSKFFVFLYKNVELYLFRRCSITTILVASSIHLGPPGLC